MKHDNVYLSFRDKKVTIQYADGHCEDADVRAEFIVIMGEDIRVLHPIETKPISND